MEVKLKTKKRKVVVSDSDQDEGGEQAVDLDALIALANAAVTVDSNIPPGGASNNPAASSHIPTECSPTGSLERERFEKEKAEIARQDAIYAKQLEQEVEIMDYIMAQVHKANAGLSSELQGADGVMIICAERIWSMKYVKSLTDEQLIAEFKKIRMAVADLKSHELRRTLKRAGEALEPDTSKKQKSTEAPISICPGFPQPLVVLHPNLLAQGGSLLAGVVISTALGEINALYMMDQSTKHFTTLREILHNGDK
ncbi:hypothetical protein Tco_0800466 [Tanacetum coccineum]|uniref:Uncharacterized protein n=1 Tax=Tanacetum coccineum TaxID=301880 RepID=A0ABQ4ZXG4_9ASTR